MINKENLFNLFPEPDDVDNKSDHDIEIKITESPHYKLSMFKKIVTNHIVFFKSYELQMKQADEKFNADEVKRQAGFVVYNRAWHYIKNIDIDNNDHIKDLILMDPYDMAYCLQLGIKYFESTEEYERCAHLFKIQKFLEKIAEKTEDLKNTLES